MNKKAFAAFAVSVMLLVGIGTANAQGGNPPCDPAHPELCTHTPPNMGNGRGGNGNGNGFGAGRQGQNNRMGGGGITANLPPATVTELPQNVIDLMIAGWKDEQNAYAIYEAIMTQFGRVAPFVNIQRAEAQHSAAWETLFTRYGIAVPTAPTVEATTFATLAEACQAGVDAEIANAALYDKMLEAFAPYPDLLQVATALRNASLNSHLPAFQNCAK